MFAMWQERVSHFLKLSASQAESLYRLGIVTLRDLVFYLPQSYLGKKVYPNLLECNSGDYVIAQVTLNKIFVSNEYRKPSRIYSYDSDNRLVLLTFFSPIAKFILGKLRLDNTYIVEGRLNRAGDNMQIIHPVFIFNQKDLVAIEPIYSLTRGLSNSQLYSYIRRGLEHVESFPEFLGQDFNSLAARNNWPSFICALRNIHLPQDNFKNTVEVSIKRLASDELIANQIAIYFIRQQEKKQRIKVYPKAKELQQKVLDRLGFELTKGQIEAICDIEIAQRSDYRMTRLLHGDVGSGKTLVALLTMINVVVQGVQSAIMAPTDLLARQHYKLIEEVLADTNINVVLLTGSLSSVNKRKVLNSIKAGEANIIIGTHALFQSGVSFNNLGYIVIDEQHRFGVKQRLELINKAKIPDVLIMTATPIPRSLILTMFGDIEVSKLGTKISNRLPIITVCLSARRRQEVIEAVERKLKKGEKIYWICPFISKDETKEWGRDMTDVESCYTLLQQYFPKRVGLLHGKTDSADQEYLMQKFEDGEVDILVATTVVEVGVDIPKATLIVIENAERFGLAQLHQLRGRVGRNNLQSHCILLCGDDMSDIAQQRLEVMCLSNDGFYIAEKDLELRGGGDLLGTKQSGEPDFFFANLLRDSSLLSEIDSIAYTIFTSNPSATEFYLELFGGRSDLVGEKIYSA